MKYEAVNDDFGWCVKATFNDGGVEQAGIVARFEWLRAAKRAQEYADWKNAPAPKPADERTKSPAENPLMHTAMAEHVDGSVPDKTVILAETCARLEARIAQLEAARDHGEHRFRNLEAEIKKIDDKHTKQWFFETNPAGPPSPLKKSYMDGMSRSVAGVAGGFERQKQRDIDLLSEIPLEAKAGIKNLRYAVQALLNCNTAAGLGAIRNESKRLLDKTADLEN